jgi:hypothetical protein
MKKLFAYILLLLFLFNSMGYYVVYEFNKMLVKRETRAIIRSNSGKLIVIRVEDAEHHPGFARIDKDEFIYENRMYDVVSEKKEGDVTIFTCIHDNKEERLVSGLKKVSGNKLATILISHIIDNALTVDRCRLDTEVPSPHFFLPYEEPYGNYIQPGFFRPPRVS